MILFYGKGLTLDKVNTDKLSTTDANTYHTAFTKHRANWQALSRARQQAFNAVFKKERLAQLTI